MAKFPLRIFVFMESDGSMSVYKSLTAAKQGLWDEKNPRIAMYEIVVSFFGKKVTPADIKRIPISRHTK